MKKAVSLILSLILLISVLPMNSITAQASYTVDWGDCGDDAYYEITSDGLLEIYGTGKMYDYNPIDDYFPSPFSRYLTKNTALDEDEKTDVKVSKIKICKGITHIGSNAFSVGYFYAAAKTLSISIASTVSSIGKYAFSGLKVNNLIIPSKVKTIPLGCFDEMKVNEKLTLKGAETIKSEAFTGSKINKIVLSKKTKKIASNAFSSELSTGTYNETAIYINSISLEKGCKKFSVYKDALYNKNKSKLIYYPSGKTKLKLPKGVKTIGKHAFDSSQIKSLTLPESVTAIESFAFCNSRLRQISIPGKVKKIPNNCFSYCDRLKNVSIPNSVTEIGYEAFYSSFIKSIDIPNSVKKIGNACIALENYYDGITIPASVKRIDDMAILDMEVYHTAYIAGYKGTAAEKYAKKNHIKFIVAPQQGKILKLNKKYIKWKKVKGVSGYDIQISTSSTMNANTKIGSTKGAGKTVLDLKQCKLKKGKTYYVQVRAYKYKKIKGKKTKINGSWSKIKKVKYK